MELVKYVDNDKEKKTNISKSTAPPQAMKLDGGLDHMYTKARKFLALAV